jgi:hypothetical protein
MDPDPDPQPDSDPNPAIFVIDLQDADIIFKDKKSKEVTKQ